MILSVQDLSIVRGGVRVLEGVGFDLDAGQALVLRGPNGIGKTTLLRTVAGLQPPLSGRIETAPDILAYVGHSDGLKSTLSVQENLSFWAQTFGQKEISGALDAYQLSGLVDRPAGLLSAGQKRRLGLARLMVTGRKLWLLDEPTVSLDAMAVQMFADAIRAHLGRGGAALMATHIDLGVDEASVLDLAPYRAETPVSDAFDEDFL